MTTLTVAGRTVPGAEIQVLEYVRERGRTIKDFDGVAGTFTAITMDAIRATRVLNSRISNVEAEWFAAQPVPWKLVEADADLCDAEPGGKLYRNLESVYACFYQQRSGVSVSKVHKVLHLMRPHAYPILDSHLQKVYRHVSSGEGGYWAAIREDVLSQRGPLEEVRRYAARSCQPDRTEIVANLSLVRVLDIAAWGL